MKIKIPIIVSIILAVTLSTCIFAASNSNDDLKPLQELAGIYEINADSVSSKLFKTGDNTEISLTYAKSMITQGDSLDMYLAENNDIYYFNTSGKIVGYKGNDSKLPDGEYDASKNYIGEETAIKIAEKQAKLVYGEIFDEFEYDHTQLSSCGNIFNIYHYINYGENGFIKGAVCHTQVTNEGNVLSTALSRYYESKDFNEALLDGITKSELRSFAKEQVQLTYGDDCKGYTINSFKLVNQDGDYKILIITDVKVTDERNPEATDTISAKFYYEL